MALVTNKNLVFTGSGTISAGTTATAVITFNVTITALQTTQAHEIIVTNNDVYAATVSIYKSHSMGTGTYTGDMASSFLVPAQYTSAGVTVSAKNAQVQGLLSSDPPIIRITYAVTTATAGFTAAVTSLVYIKELDL